MSVAGIDFGNQSVLIAIAQKGGVDVILNESSNRQTATCVSIQTKQRFFGDAASSMAKSNLFYTISDMKLLIGRKFESPATQAELQRHPFQAVKLPNGGIGINITYKDETIVVPVEHIFAMMLVKAKNIASNANNGIEVAETVLAVPHWFTDSQRHAILNACEIANLNCLKITNESNAIALSYGIFKSAKKLFSEKDPMHVMFIDLGYSGYCVTIVDFIQENMKVLSTVCDPSLGGRDFDDVIVEFLAESFQSKFGSDVRKNWKAMLKLQTAAEKAKKTLSPAGVNEVNISVECVAEDRDLSCVLTRDEFEKRSYPLVARLEAPISQCLEEAGLTKQQINEIQVVGGSLRINIIKRKLGEFLGLDPNALNYGLQTQMNFDEAVARGNALQCALLSSRIKVKTFNIVDRLPYGIAAHYDAPSAHAAAGGADEIESKEEVAMKGSSALLYSRNDEIPHKPRRLTFKKKSSDFSVSLMYEDSKFPASEDPSIARYLIKLTADVLKNGPVDVRVTFALDRNGCVFLQSALAMEEYLVPDTEGKEEKMEINENTESKDETGSAMKKKFKKIDLSVEVEKFGLSKEDIRKSIDLEAQMAFEDKLIIETANAKNDLESYIYSMRDKLTGIYAEYSTAAAKKLFTEKIDETENWLYDDGYDVSKQEYVRKLDDLKALGDPIESRFNENANRAGAIDAFRKQVQSVKSFVSTHDTAHDHITEDEREKLRESARSTEAWLFDLQNKQGQLPLHADPVLTTDIVQKKRMELLQVCNPIMTKPKPKPKVETKTATPQPQETKAEKKSDAVPMDEDSPKETSVPMDTDAATEEGV